MKEPRIKIYRGEEHVFLKIGDQEFELSPYVARQVGDTLYKDGCTVENNVEAAKKKGKA